jgi:hypothetical protein
MTTHRAHSRFHLVAHAPAARRPIELTTTDAIVVARGLVWLGILGYALGALQAGS